ncbi:FkbM family methyltransferase [Marinibacterium profundimaris]|uniref:Methyltransferase FkbM domain-containing protein n=1 Tax=Marinibacterium profundimaris TaxID=1679460 RepID=A0A225NBX1_9RHOB|nr:FkbM family methyltransferase [Marinibacterium profundimaris]MAU94904.1 hypothetical protein [Fulvimarina sp.]OWU68394.1 hypothetical protein ATO3_24225 [Marinibacterium profundimaris]
MTSASLLAFPDTDEIEEAELVARLLVPMGQEAPRRLMQIGANEGMYEYAKPDNKDFVFEFLRDHPAWGALLIEPIPETYDRLVANYAGHSNRLHFLNCAITEQVERRVLHVAGRDGKSSSLMGRPTPEDADVTGIEVACLPPDMALDLVNWDRADFVKIDAEGYDEILVGLLIDSADRAPLPDILLWEQIGPEKRGTSDRLGALGYRVLRTGHSKKGRCLDRVAIRQELLG